RRCHGQPSRGKEASSRQQNVPRTGHWFFLSSFESRLPGAGVEPIGPCLHSFTWWQLQPWCQERGSNAQPFPLILKCSRRAEKSGRRVCNTRRSDARGRQRVRVARKLPAASYKR